MRPLLTQTAFFMLALCAATLVAERSYAEPLDVRIGYVAWAPDPGPVLSNVIPEPTDAGLRGAELAIVDNNTTGRFLKHDYQLLTASEPELNATLDAARALHADGTCSGTDAG